MLIRMANLQTAALVLISVVALFFFPAPRGSFVSTHGPVTELCAQLEWAIVCFGAALSTLRQKLKLPLTRVMAWLCSLGVSPPLTEASAIFVLRI